ncbi:putative MFS family arabinose efflux permease [Kribbella antiqua]|uniref:Putative MFS family arabinose efflux permease n=1 Tax=Kribbella antiqua TaxID=2512217 RepID=A0A4R2IP16_9ACTN|nr:MFS transporter [Kribbella antiqua]TCO45739.1 putative MFS family arabinose efflux permease [Kribbella antiqua]
MELSGYRVLWRTRGVMALLCSSLLARLPVLATMVPVAFLAKDAGGSFRWAGIVAGAYSVGMAIAGPLWARTADRRGPRGVLLVTGISWSVMLAGLAALPSNLYRLMPVLSFLAGAVVPPVMQTLRAAWPRVVQGPGLRAAYALDATSQELLFIVGPMLGATAVSVASPRLGVLLAAAMSAVFIWWYALRQPAPLPHDDDTAPPLTARQLLWHRQRLPLILSFGLWVMAFNGISLGIVAFADQHGDRLIAGIMEAVWAFGSLVGGAVAGALPGRRTSYLWRRAALVAAGMLLCVFATWSPVSLGIALTVSGLTLAPAIGALYERLGALTPDTVRTEVFGWMGSAAMGGAAIGSAVSGAVVESYGVRYVWLVAAVLAAVSFVLLLRIPPQEPVAPTPEPDTIPTTPPRPVEDPA